jgi:hypothetical protein
MLRQYCVVAYRTGLSINVLGLTIFDIPRSPKEIQLRVSSGFKCLGHFSQEVLPSQNQVVTCHLTLRKESNNSKTATLNDLNNAFFH